MLSAGVDLDRAVTRDQVKLCMSQQLWGARQLRLPRSAVDFAELLCLAFSSGR
jgi:hypothetical protein